MTAEMNQFWIDNGTRSVCVTHVRVGNRHDYLARKYVNSRETATLEKWEGHTEAGARRWASKVLSN